MTLPNLITIARFLMVPAVIYALMNSQWRLAFAVFVLAGVSDGIDGYIARHFNQGSKLGAYLDPVADKLLLVTVFVTLAVMNVLPSWLVLVVVSRDVLIVAAVLVASVIGHPIAMRPLLVSKVNTAFQILLVVVALFAKAFGVDLTTVQFVLILSVAALTILSAGAYLVTWLRHMAGLAE
ncbi:MAG: CDP-alcohol phosphatidyltransferase family protein [Pararhizobium sp.]